MSDDLQNLDREALAGIVLDETLRELVKRIRNGTATAADLNVALASARHLGIGMVPTGNNSAGALRKALTDNLPFPTTGLTQ